MANLPDAKLFIDGQLRDAASGKTFDVIDPWTGEPVGKAADGGKEDVEAAIAAAREAFDRGDWSSDANRDNRLALVRKYRELFEQNKDRLGELAMHEAGAAKGAVGRAHVDMALTGFDDYIRVFPEVEWEKDYGVREAFGMNHKRIAVREPIGVSRR